MMAAMRLGAIVLRGTGKRLLLRATGGWGAFRMFGVLAMPAGDLGGRDPTGVRGLTGTPGVWEGVDIDLTTRGCGTNVFGVVGSCCLGWN